MDVKLEDVGTMTIVPTLLGRLRDLAIPAGRRASRSVISPREASKPSPSGCGL